MSETKKITSMLDLPFFYEINLSILMKRHKVIQLNTWTLVIDRNKYYSNSIWFRTPEKFKYNRVEFATLFKTIHQIDAKYFDWNHTQLQNITNQQLEHNLERLIHYANTPKHIKKNTNNVQINNNPSIEQKEDNDSPKSLQLLYKQLESVQTKFNGIEYETEHILAPKLIKLCQIIKPLQSNELIPHQNNQLILYEQQNIALIQQINENHLLMQQLKKKSDEICRQVQSEKSKQESMKHKLLKSIEMITHETIEVVSTQIINAIQCKKQIEEFIVLILQYAITNTDLMKEYVQLCVELQNKYTNDPNVIRETVVNQTRLLFMKTQKNQINDKHSYFNVMKLMAEMYIVDLFRTNLICKGILHRLLGPQNVSQLSEIDIEAVCILLIKCGEMLDKVDTKSCDKFVEILMECSKSFGDNIIELVEDLKELRENNWRRIGLQQKYSVLKDEYKELQIKYNELHVKYIGIVNRSDYRLWSGNDVANWIIDINKSKYSKYYSILMEKMASENIDGICLPNVDKNDLRRFGITNFKDNCDIYNSIQELIINVHKTTIGKECVICMDDHLCYAVLPCGHLCICSDCKDLIEEVCPICKKECKSLIRIYS
eukprot:265586_1